MTSEKLQANLQRLINELPQAIERGLQDATAQGVQHIRNSNVFQSHGTNNLKAATRDFSVGPMVRGIISDKYYASWLNYGNGPPGSRIYPTQAKALRFVINGEIFYRKFVRAAAPRPFFTNMVNWEKTNLKVIVSKHINALLESL